MEETRTKVKQLGSHSEVYDLHGHNLGVSGMLNPVCQSIESNENLLDLDLSGCSLGVKGCASVVSALLKFESIRTLDLGHNAISDLTALLSAFEEGRLSSLQHLSLAQNQLDDLMGVRLLDLVSDHPSLQTLDLSDNQLGNRAAASLAGAIRSNHVLRTVNLYRNGVGTLGAVDLSRAYWETEAPAITSVDLRVNFINYKSLTRAVPGPDGGAKSPIKVMPDPEPSKPERSAGTSTLLSDINKDANVLENLLQTVERNRARRRGEFRTPELRRHSPLLRTSPSLPESGRDERYDGATGGEIEKLEKEKVELEKEVHDSQNVIATLQKEKTELEAQVAATADDSQNVIAALQKEKTELEAQVAATADDSQNVIAALQKEKTELEAQVAATADDSQNVIAALQKEKTELEAQVAATADDSQNVIAALQKEKTELEAQVARLQGRLASLASITSNDMPQQHEELCSQIADSNEELVAADGTIAELQCRVAALTNENVRLKERAARGEAAARGAEKLKKSVSRLLMAQQKAQAQATFSSPVPRYGRG